MPRETSNTGVTLSVRRLVGATERMNVEEIYGFAFAKTKLQVLASPIQVRCELSCTRKVKEAPCGLHGFAEARTSV